MTILRVIIAGGRHFKEEEFLIESCDSVLDPLPPDVTEVEFVSGGARGADKLGEAYARDFFGIEATIFRPDYDKYKPTIAPLYRNAEMAEYANGGILIAFLHIDVAPPISVNQGSFRTQGSGTANMILNAMANEMQLHVFRYG